MRLVFDPKRAFENDPNVERPERDPAKDELPNVGSAETRISETNAAAN